MNNLIVVLKKNKFKAIVVGVVMLALILMIIAIMVMFSFKGSVYGDRCDEIKNVPITDNRKKEIKEIVGGYENIEVTDINVKCRLLDITVNLKSDMDFAIVDEMSKAILGVLSEEELELYDIELMVTSSNKENTEYPKMGTRHKVINDEANDHFVW